MKTNCFRASALALAISLAAAPGVVRADDHAALADLMKEVKALRDEVAALKAARTNAAEISTAATAPTTPAPTLSDRDATSLLGQDFLKVKGLTIGFYGESKYRLPEAGADAFDAHRYCSRRATRSTTGSCSTPNWNSNMAGWMKVTTTVGIASTANSNWNSSMWTF